MTHSTNLNRQYTQDVNTSQAYPVLMGSYESTTTRQCPELSHPILFYGEASLNPQCSNIARQRSTTSRPCTPPKYQTRKQNVRLNEIRQDWKPLTTLNGMLYGLQLLFFESNTEVLTPESFLLNCAKIQLNLGGFWRKRVKGVRAENLKHANDCFCAADECNLGIG
jgi:hypothetical protein